MIHAHVSRRHALLAALGFLATPLVFSALAAAGLWALGAPHRSALERHLTVSPYLVYALLPVGVALMTISIGAFFWTIGQLSAWSARGSRLALTCLWIWLWTCSILLAANLFLGRVLLPASVLQIILILLLWPKPGAPSWTWSWIHILERQEPRPFLWGVCAALGFMIMTLALDPAPLQSSPLVHSILNGPARTVLSSLAALAMGFVLGALMQAWTRQRWPGLSMAILLFLLSGISMAMSARGSAWNPMGSLRPALGALGLLIGDLAAWREHVSFKLAAATDA